ncbi:50S ribosomal protein L9 [Laedolimicola ammoniilytica]|uniref:Large ribosomal subunit protein bL9 n=1 Tax=Laedolimicola ammoniilytica TaxID=2981771 RepID=A0ABT2S0Y1_9FIRM|nr:50S ribosomal protein L9 [Laedolimicola ammoniilytica]MCU6698153.1 50S ribosomal protein L9 [Laedolimicola ammoniilytica]SCH13623.1 BL17 [uncultured Clostridium sp.]SCI66098.1 BL17 [uncultured Clostridium sp.]
MKVILIEDVKSLGKKGQLVEVNDGYARNFILAKKLGLEATPKNLNDLKLKKANDEKVAKEIYEEAKAFGERLKEMEVNVSIKTGEGGKIFGSVSSKEIAEAAKAQLGIELDKKKMVLPSPIKTLGTTLVPIKLHPKVTSELKVNVREA